MVLCLLFCTLLKSLDILYVHGYAIAKTLGLLRDLNASDDQDCQSKGVPLFEMLLYWITFCLTQIVMDQWLAFVPAIHTIRVLLLCAMLNPMVNLKKKAMEVAFGGERPQFEVYLKALKAKIREGIAAVKKIE